MKDNEILKVLRTIIERYEIKESGFTVNANNELLHQDGQCEGIPCENCMFGAYGIGSCSYISKKAEHIGTFDDRWKYRVMIISMVRSDSSVLCGI